MERTDNTDDLLQEAIDGAIDIVACQGQLPLQQRLVALQVAWIATAEQLRSEALAFPDGYSAERARQLDQLRRVARLVRGARPDLEGEMLYQVGAHEALKDHLMDRIDRASEWDMGSDVDEFNDDAADRLAELADSLAVADLGESVLRRLSATTKVVPADPISVNVAILRALADVLESTRHNTGTE